MCERGAVADLRGSSGEEDTTGDLNRNIKPQKERGAFTDFNILNTNARSICPKINSLLDAIGELDAAAAVVTETWLADGQTLEDDKQDLFLGSGISLIHRNRAVQAANGRVYGGVGVFYREELCKFKELNFPNPHQYEVLPVVGSLRGHTRRVVLIACYIPPNYTSARATGALEHISDLVIEAVRTYKNPHLIVTGDFNQWDLAHALSEFDFLKESDYGPTRGSRRIDRTFTNFEEIREELTLNPLQTDADPERRQESDHRLCYVSARLKRKEKYRWLKYSYRYNNKASADKFGEWLMCKDWSDVLQAGDVNRMTEMYQAEITRSIETFFPLRTIKRRNIDPPWINDAVRRLIRVRKRIFKDTGGRTDEWKKVKKKCERLIKKRRKVYEESQKLALLADDADRNFFRNTKNYMSKQRSPPFDVLDLFPGKTEQEAAELLAVHFNSISNEFHPLLPDQVPITRAKQLPVLEVHEVAIRLRKFRKPKSMVRGDVFPDLVTRYADFLAVPLAAIYNKITTTKEWPDLWKEESVTVIPKCRMPSDLSDLRNISCTMLASKIYETYVLRWALDEVKLKTNQFGGTKGCSTSHLLISVWQQILTDLEDCRAATVLTAIDYAKAFNRMSFQECLKSFARHGASTDLMRVVAAFLTGRKMSVRVGDTWSEARAVNGGVPQGSILGVLLFNITTDNLEDQDNATGFTPSTDRLSGMDTTRATEEPGGAGDEPGFEEEGLEHSTPAHEHTLEFEPGVTPIRDGTSRFVFLEEARNIRRALRLEGGNLTMIRDHTLPEEPNPVTSAVWRNRPVGKHKYVDDGIMDAKINMETVTPEGDNYQVKNKHAVGCQNLFRRVVHNAESIGMKVNAKKTVMLVVSDALSFKAKAHILSVDGQRIDSQDRLKLLGFNFGCRPNCNEHIESIRKKFRGRYWLLIHLSQNGFTEKELVKAYTTMVRPIAEYCAPVFHSMLNDKQDYELERMQATALRIIYGYGPSYADMRQEAGIETLRQRRIELCDKFARKCAMSDRFGSWFPPARSTRVSRHTLKYKEEFARCDRLRNSPLFYMRRRLNGKEGKSYGKRYCHYRDAAS